jgi:hypothetical protein
LQNNPTHISIPSHSVPIVGDVDSTHTNSLFEGHLLNKITEKPQLHFTDFDFGVATLLFVAFILFVWLYSANRKRLDQIIKAFYINRFANQLGRDELSLGNRVSVFLSILFVISFSLFISLSASFYGFNESGNETWIFIKTAAVVSCIYGLKIMILRFLGYVFQTQKEAGEYAMMVFLFCNILGLFLLPIVVCMAFVRDLSPLVFIYIGISLFVFLLFIRLLRGVIIGFNSMRVSKFYLFLYLCTLEILPFLIIAKLFMLNAK